MSIRLHTQLKVKRLHKPDGGRWIVGTATTPTTDRMGDDEVEMVNLWQRNLVGFKSILAANWEVQRDGGVAVLTGVNWGA